MGIREKLEELSLLDLSKKTGADLASLTTRHFSTERRGIQGDAPQSTKLITSRIDFANDWITYYFLTEATEKYGPDYAYKDVEPDKNFQFERNPSKTYEIQLRFKNVSQLINLSRGTAPETQEQPQAEAPLSQPEAPVQPAPAPAPQQVKKPQVKPQYKKPVAPAPIEPAPQPVQKPVAQKKVTPKNAVPSTGIQKAEPRTAAEKPRPQVVTEPEDQQMSLGFGAPEDPYQSEFNFDGPQFQKVAPAGNPNPKKRPNEDEIDKQVTGPMGESTLQEGLNATDVKNWLWNTDMQIWSNAPSFHWQGFNFNLSQLNASIYPTDIEPQVWDKIHGNALIDKHLFDLFIHIKFFLNQMASSLLNKVRTNRESRIQPMNKINTSLVETAPKTFRIEEDFPAPAPIKWGKDSWGIYCNFSVGDSDFSATFTSEELLRSTLMSFDDSSDKFVYTFDDDLDWKERNRAYELLARANEVTFSFDDDANDNPMMVTGKGHAGEVLSTVRAAIEKYMRYEHDKVDILSFSADTDSHSRAKIYLRFAKDIVEAYPEYQLLIATIGGSGYTIIFVIKKELYNKVFGPSMHEAEETQDIKQNLVCSIGAYAPPTSEHIRLLKKVVATAEHLDGSNVLFIQSNPNFKGDEISSKIKADALSRLVPNLNVCINEGVETVYDALLWAYNHQYSDITFIVGSDQQAEFEAILAENDKQTTPQGYFEFNSYKVVSYGGSNPDKCRDAIIARDALLQGDLSRFVDAVELASYQDAQSLFKALKYELESGIGLDESVNFKEMGPQAIYNIMKDKSSYQRLITSLKTGDDFFFKSNKPTDNKGNPVDFESMKGTLAKMWRKLRSDGVAVQQGAFEMLLRKWYPKETQELPNGFLASYKLDVA